MPLPKCVLYCMLHSFLGSLNGLSEHCCKCRWLPHAPVFPFCLRSRPICMRCVPFGTAGQIDLTAWESVIQVPSISKITFSDVVWTAPSTNADSAEERHFSASEQGSHGAPLAPGQAVSPMYHNTIVYIDFQQCTDIRWWLTHALVLYCS